MEIGLKINKDKTLAMIQTRSKASNVNTDQQLHAGEHSIKIVVSIIQDHVSLTIIMTLQKSKGH
jgi:predicted class III extradiol MEMO1 family dioxygenase